MGIGMDKGGHLASSSGLRPMKIPCQTSSADLNQWQSVHRFGPLLQDIIRSHVFYPVATDWIETISS